ncbi:hypothetical protein MOUN0_N01398 [Monosporozyma unispora]|nr:hypothetical protein C6P44_001744 [Kazachstania unispora]
MESLRAFARSNRFLDRWQRGNDEDETQNEGDELKLLLQKNPDITDDAHLFHILNQFVTIFNKRDKIELNDDSEDERKIWDDKIQTVLRYGLLKSLRKWDQTYITPSLRQVLNHWWVTMLNNLRISRTHATRLELPVLTTFMECISRIMDLLICLPNGIDDMEQDLNIYCNYLLLTCHYITSQLNRNSKSNFTYQYIKQFNDLLHAQLGLLNALAFIFLPDTLEYNTLVINLLTKGKFKTTNDHNDILLPWKTHTFKRTRNFPRIKYNAPKTHNVKCFNIIISYLQEEKTFLSFTWHYWRLMLLFCDATGVGLTQSNIHDLIYGSEIVIHYTVNKNFQQDISKFSKITRQVNNGGIKNNNTNGSNANIQLDKLVNYHKTNKSLSEFIETRFQMLRLWKEPLYQLFMEIKDTEKICSILLQYDNKQLLQLSKISLYETQLTNLIFNKYLTMIILDQYDYGKMINWDPWTKIIVHSLKTLSFENQINILKFLFNIWKYIPTENQLTIIKEIISLKELTNFQYSQTLILINKLIVFRFLPNEPNKLLIIPYLLQLQDRYDQLLSENELKFQSYEKSSHVDSLLLFDNNRKYVLSHKKIRHHYNKKPYISFDKDFVVPVEENIKEDIKGDDDDDDDKDDDDEDNMDEDEEDDKVNDTPIPKIPTFSYKVVPIFKNVMMPYSKNQQHYIERYNNKWKNIPDVVNGNTESVKDENMDPQRLQFDLSTYNIDIDSMKLSVTTPIAMQTNDINTLVQLHNFIKTFNLTMIEYYDFMNLYSKDYIRIEV